MSEETTVNVSKEKEEPKVQSQSDVLAEGDVSVDQALEEYNKFVATRRQRTLEMIEKECKIKPAQIQKWKADFGRIKTTMIQGQWYIFRGLSRLEWQQISDMEARAEQATPSAALKKEERMVNRCLLYPSGGLDPAHPAQGGVASVLVAEVMKFSGFEPDMFEAIEL